MPGEVYTLCVGSPRDCALPPWGHLQMVVLMDPMEDPDDILRAHRSREKSYLFDVAFDFTATQVRESMVCLETQERPPPTLRPARKDSQGTLLTFSPTFTQWSTFWNFARL